MNFCPSFYELTSWEILPPQLAAHVTTCARCRGVRTAWEADASHAEIIVPDAIPEVSWPHPVYPDLDAPPVPGALHSIWGPEDGQLLVAVIIDVDDHEALVVPVSDQPQQAGDWDLLLDESVLPYPAMAELWNHLRVLRDQIMEQVARLDAAWIEAITRAFEHFMAGEPLPEGLRQGPPLLGESDPRHRFRDVESERVRWFTEPWRILFAAETFGGVLQGRRSECELDVDGLSEELDLPSSSLARLEADQEDLTAAIPKATLVRLIKRLQLPPSMRLVDLVKEAAAANAREAPPPLELTRARRRRSVRSARPELPEEVRHGIAESYVQGLLERLKDES